jgi:hypothetical protein
MTPTRSTDLVPVLLTPSWVIQSLARTLSAHTANCRVPAFCIVRSIRCRPNVGLCLVPRPIRFARCALHFQRGEQALHRRFFGSVSACRWGRIQVEEVTNYGCPHNRIAVKVPKIWHRLQQEDCFRDLGRHDRSRTSPWKHLSRSLRRCRRRHTLHCELAHAEKCEGHFKMRYASAQTTHNETATKISSILT